MTGQKRVTALVVSQGSLQVLPGRAVGACPGTPGSMWILLEEDPTVSLQPYRSTIHVVQGGWSHVPEHAVYLGATQPASGVVPLVAFAEIEGGA